MEHTTGVVFRVGTPGRLAGRCLWPSLSSRKSKATGVVAVPFSSISPLHHLLRFLPSFYSLSFSFSLLLSRSLHPHLRHVLFLFLSLSLLITTFSHRACRVYVSKILFLRCARRRIHVPARHGRVSYSRIRCNGARVKTTKKQVKVSQSRQSVASLVSCTPRARTAPAASFRRLYFFKTPRGLKGLQAILDCWACKVPGKNSGSKDRAPHGSSVFHCASKTS